MADSLRDELRQFVLPNVRLTGTRLGAGAYGSAEEVEIPGAICAAKKIHDVFQDRSEIPAALIRKAARQFVEECQLMSTLRHPHIVQFLGVCFLEGSRLPALVMERLLTSLHDLLDPDTKLGTLQHDTNTKPYFPMGLKCSILCDVTRGLVYLQGQSPPIIHRDLSARNVLVNSAMVAKIADLGVARILPSLRVATMTKAPGAFIYMPPEALESKSKEEEEKSRYDVTIDIFSLGVVAIFTISQTFPCNLLTPNYRDERRRLMARTELERRETYMQEVHNQLREGHPLIQMIEQCLENFPEDRPTIQQVVQLLEQARAAIGRDESDVNKLELIRILKEREQQRSRREIAQLRQQLQSSEALLHVKERESVSLTQQLQQREAELENKQREKQQLEASKGRKVAELQQRLRSNEALLAEFQGKLENERREKQQLEVSKRREVAELQQRLRSNEALLAEFQGDLLQRERELEELRSKGTGTTQLSSLSRGVEKGTPKEENLTLRWSRWKNAPAKMWRGSAVTHGSTIYIMGRNSNNLYNLVLNRGKEWSRHSQCPHVNAGLVIINDLLTAVGGEKGGRLTNKLVSWKQGKWVEVFPPMQTARKHHPVVSNGDYVVAVGGEDETSVEVFDVLSHVWSRVISLPVYLKYITATMCHNDIIVMNGVGTCYKISLDSLLSSQHMMKSSSPAIDWMPLPPAAAEWGGSTLTTFHGQAMTLHHFGVHQLYEGQWVSKGRIFQNPWMPIVCVVDDQIVVMGGRNGPATDIVQVAVSV